MASTNDFLTNLGGILNQQFETGDNKLTSLNIAQNGTNQFYGKLGSFANEFDQSADRSYTEEGSIRTDYYNPRPKQLDLLTQEPDATVLVKKRAFASLAENYRLDLMDEQEKLFYKTTKILFQNKCKQISAYEKLAKIATISADLGRVDYHLLPILFAATDALPQTPGDDGFNTIQDTINGTLSKFKSIVDRVREIVGLSQDSNYTTWLTGIPDSFRSDFGEGTGVIEFTNITSLSTTTTIKLGQGSFRLEFSDPYEMMLITNWDIEQAINDAHNKFYSNSYFQLGITSLDDTISLAKRNLNDIRASRNASPIIFQVNPDAFLGKRVSAIIDNIGFEIKFDASSIGNLTGGDNIDPSALFGSPEAGINGLTNAEVNLFNNIVSSLYNQISLTVNTRRKAFADNQDVKKGLNSLRKKMRLHYGNKLLIQPMDNVHIYLSSKKKIDDKIVGGLQGSFQAQGFLQGVNNLVQNIKDTFAINEQYNLEKSIFVGNDFPNWLWMAMRSQFVSDRNGAHVFAGIVEKASSTHSGGFFSVSVSGSDNGGYFGYGVVNFKPSVNVFNGSLYDPLTPFKLEFDSATGVLKQKNGTPELLDENKGLFSSAFVKDKNGLLAGIKPTIDTFTRQDADRLRNNSVRRVFYDPDGMVYRWKEGIATLVLFGDSYDPTAQSVYNQPPAITSNPFAGQDIMNVLSLLISGEPYNFNTFYKAAIQFDNFKKDPTTNEDPSGSYFRGLQTQLKYRNAIYGNFVPFKKLTMDNASFTKILHSQLNAIKYDADLNDLIQQRAALADKLSFFGKTTANDFQNVSDSQLLFAKQNLSAMDQQIQAKLISISNELFQDGNPPVRIVGDDISYDYDSSDVNASGSKTRLEEQSRKDLIRKLNFLTRRLAWKVRANEDVNFLLVDDTYDKDYDIQAFEKSFVPLETYKSEYMTVADQINAVAGTMQDLEVFCNTQGHIEVRNPKYNRMPSSVFYKMLRMKNELGIQTFPQFLEDLFVNQVNELYKNIEVLEDEIRLYCLALGNATDTTCVSFINNFDKGTFGNSARISGTIGSFAFISDETTGKILQGALDLSLEANPDKMIASVQSRLSSINSQSSISAFSLPARVSFVQSAVNPAANSNSDFKNLSQIQDLATTTQRGPTLTKRLFEKTGQTFDLNQLFNNTTNSIVKTSTISSVDILQISNGIAERLSSRQRAIKQAANSLKNIQEGLTLFNGNGGTGDRTLGNALLFPSLYDSKSIPKVFEHMIEDESYDDLGPDSGKRYVIKNHDIIRYEISENRPRFTSIEVTGSLGPDFIDQNQLSPDLNVFGSGSGGNAQVTAAAVDYDLWRMYGISIPQSVNAPFLSNPDTQCAPYAVSLLNKSRQNIFQGSVDVIGNEYQQPGEVIYLENRDLLFYVESVSHSFQYGRQFTTSMQLTYGHNPGEYIPTPFDVIGKVLYKNKDITHFANKRQGNVFNQEHIGVIVGNANRTDPSAQSFQLQDDIVSGPYANLNKINLQNIIDHGGQILSTATDNITPTLEVRVYFNSANPSFNVANLYATDLRNTVLNYLTGATDLGQNAKPTANQSSDTKSLSAFASQIIATDVNANPNITGEFRYPSAKAFHYAREVVNNNSSSIIGTDLQSKIDTVVWNFIVDVWIVFKNPSIGG